MRLLFWCEGFPPYIGGVEVLAGEFVRDLSRRGYEILVVAGKHSDELPDESEYRGVPVHRFAFWRSLAGRDLDQIALLRRRVAALKASFGPDLIHVNQFKYGIVFHHQTSTVSPAPLLVTLHGILPEHFYGPDTLFGPLLGLANWIVACSSNVLCELRQLRPELKCRSSLVRSTLPPPAVPPSPLTFEPPRLLCAGRLSEEKGFDLALKCFAILVDRFPTARLLVAGDGPERATLERLAGKLGVDARVDFLGWVGPNRVPALLNTATLVIAPSRSESLGLIAVQAAQMARPIVATRVGGLPEVVVHEETGLLVEPEDSQALAEAAATLLRQPTVAAQMGREAHARATRVFDWQLHLDGYHALYQRLRTA